MNWQWYVALSAQQFIDGVRDCSTPSRILVREGCCSTSSREANLVSEWSELYSDGYRNHTNLGIVPFR